MIAAVDLGQNQAKARPVEELHAVYSPPFAPIDKGILGGTMLFRHDRAARPLRLECYFSVINSFLRQLLLTICVEVFDQEIAKPQCKTAA